MITSASHRRWRGDIEISDLTITALPAASIVRSAKIATIEALDAAKIGCLPSVDRRAVRDRIVGMVAAILSTKV